MLAVTLDQPVASVLLACRLTLINQQWKPQDYAVGRRLLVVASGRAWQPTTGELRYVRSAWPLAPAPRDFPLNMALGFVRLNQVVAPTHPRVAMNSNARGPHVWLVSQHEPLAEPVPMPNNRPGVWRLNKAQVQEVTPRVGVITPMCSCGRGPAEVLSIEDTDKHIVCLQCAGLDFFEE